MARSSVLRLGFGNRLAELLAAGRTIDEITEALNSELAAAGRSERVSRSAVGRAVKSREGLLAAKLRQDQVIATLRGTSSLGEAAEAQLEIVRTLLFEAAAQALGNPDALTPKGVKAIAGGLLDVERAGQLAGERVAEAERRARGEAADRGEQAARRQGVSREAAAAIRAAVEGQPDRTAE